MTLGFDTGRFPPMPPACYRASWQLPGPDLHRQATTSLRLTINHLHDQPPGLLDAQWNKIQHRLFSQITMNWRGRPLTSHRMIVDLIGNTTTTTGLTIHCVLDTDQYPTGITYTAKDVDTLPITRHEFHGEWNYTVEPTRPKTT